MQIIQQRSRGILTIPYELLKGLCWLESSITWCDRLWYPTDKWIGRNILKWKVTQKTTTRNTGQQYMSYLPSNRKWNVACIWFFSRAPLQFFWGGKGFNHNRPTQVILIRFASGFTRPRFYGPCTFAGASVWSPRSCRVKWLGLRYSLTGRLT